MLIHIGTGSIEFPDVCKPVRQIMVLPYLALDGSARGSTGVAWWAACSCHAQSTKHLDSKKATQYYYLTTLASNVQLRKTIQNLPSPKAYHVWKTVEDHWFRLALPRFFCFDKNVVIVRLRRGSCRACSCDGFRRRLPSWLGGLPWGHHQLQRRCVLCVCVCMCVSLIAFCRIYR